MNKELKPLVFWPPFIFILISVIYSLINVDSFLAIASGANVWILDHFSWAFAYGSFMMLLVVVAAYFSRLGGVKIGGEAAIPLLPKWKWFSITLCTTIATGILFWTTAEPLYHFHAPSISENIVPLSHEAYQFSMATMMMHWTVTPYGIYTCAALLFALVYYNMRQPFSLASMLFPIMGKRVHGKGGDIINAICLYTLIAGMSASLGAGILTIRGGINMIFDYDGTAGLSFIIALTIVLTFIVSANSGLLKGIKTLSDINIKIFIGLAIFVLVFGPTAAIFNALYEGVIGYGNSFISRSIDTGIGEPDRWTKDWTIFYWANWLAWTPVTALFLGRLGRGYDVRTFIRFNLLYPAAFSMIWIAIFSGTALSMDQMGEGNWLYAILQEYGPERVMFSIIEKFPIANIISIIFLVAAFLSYVTAADSNTSAMSGICSIGITPENPEAPSYIKIIWGALIGLVAWVMITYAGIDGIKMTSNLGGMPALLIVLLVALGLIKYIVKGVDQ